MNAADSTRSTVFKVFLEAFRQKYGKVAFVTDNAASHKSHLIQEYLKSTGGDMVLIYLPPHTPQLNPMHRLQSGWIGDINDLDYIVRVAGHQGVCSPPDTTCTSLH